ncbi:MAG TPA: hypothetical protein PKI12_08915, partial [Bacteroidales bacterium]|nr:hypothetical protein [Bacteroidales bacterium]
MEINIDHTTPNAITLASGLHNGDPESIIGTTPIAAAIAPNVIIFRVCPVAYKTINVKRSVTGIVIKIVKLAFIERRKRIATK